MLSEFIFGKNLIEITFEDLQNFFHEEQEESSLLEFKSGGVSIDDVYKEVCAFLNTEGGILIIGTPREAKKKPTSKTEVTICQGELTPSNFRGKDWLMTKIVSNISPSPTNIKIQEFHSKEGSYFIVEVPQSFTPPHQSNEDGRYYIRLEREAKPAPHGVVEALFFRRQKPKLNLTFNFEIINDEKINCKMSISNISPYPTEKVSYTVQIIGIAAVHPVYEVDTSHTHGNMYSLGYTSNQVLWKGLFINPKFYITHNRKPFYITIMAWSRNAELITMVGIFDPIKMQFVEQENDASEVKKGDKYYRDKV
ncbi:ATP-binding protein [Fluviicola sp.]|uniref:AlbA family DNA-binding domain-containing protein n=1 Tax=Fluviicola sp. TaxID=1917219 RepID=UPI002603313B|nr:ATP-binding protein [Fluviicola sp.]